MGKDSENGAELAVEEINETHPVIAGTPVKFVLDTQDDAADPRTGTQVAQKLVDDKVIGVVGDINSGVSIPASRVYSDAGVVQISPASTNPAYTQQGFKTTFRVVATDDRQGTALAEYAATNLHAKTVAIVDDATAYGQGLADEFEKALKGRGITVVAREATNDKATDFRALLTKIKGLSPDVIMYGGSDATAAPFLRQAANLGIHAKVIGGDGLCTDQMMQLSGKNIIQLACSQAGLDISNMPRGMIFAKEYQTRFNRPMEQFAPFSHDAVYVIVDAEKRANALNRAKILAAMPSTKVDGVIGLIEFDPKGDLKNAAVTVYEFPHGRRTVVRVIKM